MPELRILAVDGSPAGGGRTARVLEAVAQAAGAAPTQLVSLADGGVQTALEAAEEAEAFIFGSPMYRATYAHPLKEFLDNLPRGLWGEDSAPITGRGVAIVGTGASWHHFLGLQDLRSVLAVFFAAHVLPPGLYVPREGFTDDGDLAEPFAEQAQLQGRALVELARAIQAGSALGALTPQA